MPQLDKLTVLSNVFWFSCCFFLFYLLVLKYAIPRLVRLVMFRKLAANEKTNGKANYAHEGFISPAGDAQWSRGAPGNGKDPVEYITYGRKLKHLGETVMPGRSTATGWVPVANTLRDALENTVNKHAPSEKKTHGGRNIQGGIVELGQAGARHAMLLEQTHFALAKPGSQISIISWTFFTEE
uniref:ATP synthase subunit 8 n=1 Tax=Caulerpa lentillifera TaxID=148947 RepID=A0A2Z2QKI6_9CHLO|nr:ATP synthase subunit 8 [Caulerpa lentillifera]AST24256.1 ATP synthase subunit 8 [Caulerpa lentillifera]QKS32226.1 ATP synthase subunit 8 [Caulerpa lentillifera]